MRSLIFCLVRAGRLELPHLAALDPKSSVSTNSTTPAIAPNKLGCKYKQYLQTAKKFIIIFLFLIHKNFRHARGYQLYRKS